MLHGGFNETICFCRFLVHFYVNLVKI